MTTVQNEQIQLFASDAFQHQRFGSSVAISGNNAIVGAREQGNKGAVYIFELSNGTWSQTQKLQSDPLVSHSSFASSKNCAISGNYAIFGSSIDKAYIFERGNDGTWTQHQILQSSDTGTNLRFGKSVAISGDYAIVGSWGFDSSRGSAYIFERNNDGVWVETAKLLASAEKGTRTVAGWNFGQYVAISGNYAVVSSPYKDHYTKSTETSRTGAVYIFERSNDGVWGEDDGKRAGEHRIQTAKLVPSDRVNSHIFGNAVAISGDYVIVGANHGGEFTSAGAAYIFERSNDGVWGSEERPPNDNGQGAPPFHEETTKLVASDGAANNMFGYEAVSINGNYAIVGTRNETSYIFKRSNDGVWEETVKLIASDAAAGNMARSVSISGNYAIVGAPGHDGNVANTGAAYIFDGFGGSSGGSESSEEQSATSSGISTDDINIFKTGTFTVTNGKSTLDNTRKAKLLELMQGATDATEKRRKRRAALKLLFSQETTLKKMVVPKADLDLPLAFTKTNAIVVKAGETFNINELGADEGFYSVLNDGETFTVTTSNTTLTFTRSDVGDNELYEVSATDWTDIVINSDNVSTGSFSNSDNTGTLAPDDSVTIDGRVFIIGSVADGGASGSGGDPYVFPINSNCPVKLPNKPAVYRMFEQGNNYVNVEVAKATNEHKHRMIEYANKITPVTHNIVMDGYFYQKAFISAEGHKLTIDYNTKKVSTDEASMKFFSMKQSKKLFDCGEFKEDSCCWTVGWTTKENKKIQVQLMFFPNPHIENGINVIPSTLKKSTGLIVDNYKPKLMELPSLSTEKFSKLHRRLAKTKKIHQKMNIKGKNEKWVFN